MKIRFIVPFLLIFFILVGCNLTNSGKLNIQVSDNGQDTQYIIPAGLTVKQALDQQQIQLNPLDKITPDLSSPITGDLKITITRVKEEFKIEESILSFEQQTVKNESLPEGQTVLIQPGENGSMQTMYRILYENGIEVSKNFVSSDVIKLAKPEIVMIGVQSPFTAAKIIGRLAYITSSNAWLMDENTGNRRPLVTTGDLDGRIFEISPDREWLLFSRSVPTSKQDEINRLWMISLSQTGAEPIDTNISNVVHFATWVPGRVRTIAYSSVEYRSTPPGWQANNDLYIDRFDDDGKLIDSKLIVEPNAGGIYGWWGTTFQFSSDGSKLAYSRPDSIGLVNINTGLLDPILEMTPFQTRSDWAWVPDLSWSPDDRILYTTAFVDSSQIMNGPSLLAILLDQKQAISILPNCGLFCAPSPSALQSNNTYQVAFLSAITPDQSETSRYNLKIMDRDASNQIKLFPGEGVQGLNPQIIKWSPQNQDLNSLKLAFIAQGNIMIFDGADGSIHQVTGDGSATKLDWK